MYHLFYGDKNGSVGTELSFLKCRWQDKHTAGQMRLQGLVYLFQVPRVYRFGKKDSTASVSIAGR